MEAFAGSGSAIQNFFGAPKKKNSSTVIYTKGGPKVSLDSKSATHGGFDNDVPTLNSTLRIIRGGKAPKKPFVDNG